MTAEIIKLAEQYHCWLKEKTRVRQIEGWVEITLPYLDRHNDYLQIYAKAENGRILLTDDGCTIQDLIQTGCRPDSGRRKELLAMTLKAFGIQTDGEALFTYTSAEDFCVRQHHLVQTMLAVNDLFYLSVPASENLFMDDVTEWLDRYDIRYIRNVRFTGSSGYDNLFDFVIPKSREQPERILKAVSRPSRSNAEAFVWAWINTQDVRPANSRAYSILNDSGQTPSVKISAALRNYGIQPVLWSRREAYTKELSG